MFYHNTLPKDLERALGKGSFHAKQLRALVLQHLIIVYELALKGSKLGGKSVNLRDAIKLKEIWEAFKKKKEEKKNPKFPPPPTK